MKTGVVSNTGAVALALSLLVGNAWAAPSCARPQDVAALRTAALQQQLMVAALTCGDVNAYNGFVLSHRGALQKSDSALMSFFVRREQDAQKGADDYNAYKTWLANDSSLRSLRDPRFCRSASVTFHIAHDRMIPVADLPSKRRASLGINYTNCMPDASENIMMADATPNLPTRHQALPDSLSMAPAPVLASSRPDRLMPPAFPRHDVLPSQDQSFDSAEADGPPPGDNADGPRYPEQPQANDAYEESPYDRDADARDDNARDTGGRDNADTENSVPPYAPRNAYVQRPRGYDGRDDRNGDDADDYSNTRSNVSPYASRNAYVQQPRGYDRGNDRSDDNADDNSDGYDNGPSANDGPDTYRDAPDAPDTYGPPATPRMVRGRDGRWYQLTPRGD